MWRLITLSLCFLSSKMEHQSFDIPLLAPDHSFLTPIARRTLRIFPVLVSYIEQVRGKGSSSG
jgi:hypothetical protein